MLWDLNSHTSSEQTAHGSDKLGYDFAACRFVDENAATAHQSLSGRKKRKLSACAVNLRRYCRAGRARKQQTGKKIEVWDRTEPSPWTPQGCHLRLWAVCLLGLAPTSCWSVCCFILDFYWLVSWRRSRQQSRSAMVIPNFWLRISSQAIFGHILEPIATFFSGRL